MWIFFSPNPKCGSFISKLVDPDILAWLGHGALSVCRSMAVKKLKV